MLLIEFPPGIKDVTIPILSEHDRNSLVDGLPPPVLQILIPFVAVELPSRLQEAIAEW